MPVTCEHDTTFQLHHDCQGERQRIHALVIGVGRYHPPAPRYGTRLPSLNGAALAASRFASYLVNEFQRQDPNGYRLATLRLMLSPLSQENSMVDALLYGQGQTQKHGPAERADVAVALKGWAKDCDTNEDNLAILYVAGHGVILSKGISLLFLADAPAQASLAQAAVNLVLVEERMNTCAAKKNLFFYDCCTVRPEEIPDDPASAMTTPVFPKPPAGKKTRASLVCVNAARPGAETYSINDEGTLLARGLLGEYRGHAGKDALLRTACEIVPDIGFGITPMRLNYMLPLQLLKIADEQKIPRGNSEPNVLMDHNSRGADGLPGWMSGRYAVEVITVPDPVPEFDVTLTELRTGRNPPVSVWRLVDGKWELLTADADDVEVFAAPAGECKFKIAGDDSHTLTQNLTVSGPTMAAVPGD